MKPSPSPSHSVLSTSLEESRTAARTWLAALPREPAIVLLQGLPGSGKSFFVKCCLQELGLIGDAAPFSSPSFTLVNEYPFPEQHAAASPAAAMTAPAAPAHDETSPPPTTDLVAVFHIDLYRIQSSSEFLTSCAWDEEQVLYFVEWPEHLNRDVFTRRKLPIMQISFEIVNETTRRILFH